MRLGLLPAAENLGPALGDLALTALRRVYDFAFTGMNRYVGYLKPRAMEVSGPFQLRGTTVTPLPVDHGRVMTTGFLFQHLGAPEPLKP